MAVRRLLVLGLPLAIVAALAAALPTAGYNLPTAGTFPAGVPAGPLRVVLLVLAYALVGAAAYRRTHEVWPVAVAILTGAAVGWAGWEWGTSSFGWPLFAAVVLLLEWQNVRVTAIAVVALVIWALVDSSAAWPALLLITRAVGRRDDRRERLLCLAGGLLTLAVLLARNVDLQLVYLSAERPWVWADGQATNKLGDPMGVALFGFTLLLLLLRALRPVQPSTIDLPSLAVFIFLAWHARRNGIWVGLAAVPAVAVCLAGDRSRWRIATLAVAQAVVLVALLLAARSGPALVGGAPLPATAIAALPLDGLIVYRPAFEPALRQARPEAQLALADLHRGEDGQPARYTAWTRIETNCAPAEELDRLQASAVVLDPRADRATFDALAVHPAWRVAAVDPTATVLLRTAPRP